MLFSVIVGLPSLPRLVVTRITPLPARAPYTAAEASLSTEIDSISFASMLLKSPSTPSTITSGGSKPRMLSVAASAPGRPLCCLVIRPGSRPASALVVLATGATVRSSERTVATAPVRLSRLAVP